MKLKYIFIVSIWLLCHKASAQDSTFVLSAEAFINYRAYIADLDGWMFHEGFEPSYLDANTTESGWTKLAPNSINPEMADEEGRMEGVFKTRIQIDSNLVEQPLLFFNNSWTAMDVYIDGSLIHSFGNTGRSDGEYKEYNPNHQTVVPLYFRESKEYVLTLHFVTQNLPVYFSRDFSSIEFSIVQPEFFFNKRVGEDERNKYQLPLAGFTGALTLLFWLIYLRDVNEKQLLFFALTTTAFFIFSLTIMGQLSASSHFSFVIFRTMAQFSLGMGILVLIPLTIIQLYKNKILRIHWLIAIFFSVLILLFLFEFEFFMGLKIYRYGFLLLFVPSLAVSFYYAFSSWKNINGSKKVIALGLLAPVVALLITGILVFLLPKYALSNYGTIIFTSILGAFPLSLLVYISLWFKDTLNQVENKASEVIRVTEEKRSLLDNQNIILEKQVNERTVELKNSLDELRSAQAQLIQSEKMASLGELTAGIAHEIQNPLNFVNNFAEVSNELIDEMNEELDKGDLEEVKAISSDLKQNLEKINHHGKRADTIVKGMLEHSRTNTGQKEPTDINSLADEYLRLAYHGLRAKDKAFNATMETDFDDSIGKVKVIPQDIGRVVLNLITNAFYAVNERSKKKEAGYEPTVSVTTKRVGNQVEIKVSDNGFGIPQDIKDKIFQPFFTTKPTGQGTGLGLSLSYDIVKAHGGEIKLESKENKGLPDQQSGTEFIIILPIQTT